MAKWRNTGAPFTTADGVRVGRMDIFEAPAGARDVVMRKGKLEPVEPQATVTTTEVSEPEPEPDERDLRFPGIEFGSEVAYETARDTGLIVADFEDREGSGVDGAFLKSDVEEILSG